MPWKREPVKSAVTLKDTKEFLGDFDPETSSRERRKLTRAGIYKSSYTNALHDRDGKMVEDGSDFCDCLEPDCPGCHFPCVKCGSQKCSVDCRRNRKWTPDFIELEGTNRTITLEDAVKVHKERLLKEWEKKKHHGQEQKESVAHDTETGKRPIVF